MIKDRNIDPGASISIDKLAFPNIISGKHTDGSLPKVVWVAKGGADADGSTGVSRVGGRDEPFLTVSGNNGALRYTVDGRGDRIILGPGTWRENWDFGSGTGVTGVDGRMNKRDIGIYGSGGAHPGRTQVVGNGTAVGPTIRVRDNYLRGFVLSDLEVGSVDTADADRAQPLMDLLTDDTATLTATSSDEFAVLRNVHFRSDTTATIGLLLTGAQMVIGYDLIFSGITWALAFRGSLSNFPDHCYFHRTKYFDNVTADVATIAVDGMAAWSNPRSSSVNLTNVQFYQSQYMDRGGTPVTNYVNVVGTVVNCGDYEFVSARDVADDTLMALPVDWIAIGRSAASAEFIIGA